MNMRSVLIIWRGVIRPVALSACSLLLWFIGAHVIVSHAAIPSTERDTLLLIYDATNGGSWTLNAGWCTKTPCPATSPTFSAPGTECRWYAVVCDDAEMHVIGLELSANHLTGAFPSVAGLPQLGGMRISSNYLSGPLPDISPLHALVDFEADQNRYTGHIPDLSGFPQLEHYSASYNALSGELPAFGENPRLSLFRAVGNALSGSIPNLSNLPTLAIFDVSANQLSGPIPDLSALTALSVFAAEDNQLSGSIPPLTDLPLLYFFDVSRNQLTGSIGDLPVGLYYFLVGNNRLTGPVPSAPANLQPSSAILCPNPLDLTPSGNDEAWDFATGYTPWWADPSPGNQCDDLLNAGFEML